MLFILIIETEEDLSLIDELFQNHHKELYRVSFKILRDENTAEEVLQDAFIKIIDHLQRIKKIPRPEMIKFCVVMVKNASFDILRKKINVVCFDELEKSFIPNSPLVEDDYIKKENATFLMQALDAIPQNDKQIIQLRWGENMSFRQIGDLLGVSEGLANKRAQRAIEKLKKEMVIRGKSFWID